MAHRLPRGSSSCQNDKQEGTPLEDLTTVNANSQHTFDVTAEEEEVIQDSVGSAYATGVLEERVETLRLDVGGTDEVMNTSHINGHRGERTCDLPEGDICERKKSQDTFSSIDNSDMNEGPSDIQNEDIENLDPHSSGVSRRSLSSDESQMKSSETENKAPFVVGSETGARSKLKAFGKSDRINLTSKAAPSCQSNVHEPFTLFSGTTHRSRATLPSSQSAHSAEMTDMEEVNFKEDRDKEPLSFARRSVHHLYGESKNIFHAVANSAYGRFTNTNELAVNQQAASHIQNFEVVDNVQPFLSRFTTLDWHPRMENILAVCSNRGDIAFYSVGHEPYSGLNLKEKIPGIGPEEGITHLKFHPTKDNLFFTSSKNGQLCLRDMTTLSNEMLLEIFDIFMTHYSSFEVHQTENYIVAGQSNGVGVLAHQSGLKVWNKQLHHREITSMGFSPREEHLFFSSAMDGTVRLWDLRHMVDLKPMETLFHQKAVSSAAFSNTDGNRLLTTDAFDELRVYKGPSWRLETSIRHPHRMWYHETPIKASWHPQRDIVMCGRRPDLHYTGYRRFNSIDVFDAATGDKLAEAKDTLYDGIPCLNKVNMDGDKLAVAMGYNMTLWNSEVTFIREELGKQGMKRFQTCRNRLADQVRMRGRENSPDRRAKWIYVKELEQDQEDAKAKKHIPEAAAEGDEMVSEIYNNIGGGRLRINMCNVDPKRAEQARLDDERAAIRRRREMVQNLFGDLAREVSAEAALATDGGMDRGERVRVSRRLEEEANGAYGGGGFSSEIELLGAVGGGCAAQDDGRGRSRGEEGENYDDPFGGRGFLAPSIDGHAMWGGSMEEEEQTCMEGEYATQAGDEYTDQEGRGSSQEEEEEACVEREGEYVTQVDFEHAGREGRRRSQGTVEHVDLPAPIQGERRLSVNGMMIWDERTGWQLDGDPNYRDRHGNFVGIYRDQGGWIVKEPYSESLSSSEEEEDGTYGIGGGGIALREEEEEIYGAVGGAGGVGFATQASNGHADCEERGRSQEEEEDNDGAVGGGFIEQEDDRADSADDEHPDLSVDCSSRNLAGSLGLGEPMLQKVVVRGNQVTTYYYLDNSGHTRMQWEYLLSQARDLEQPQLQMPHVELPEDWEIPNHIFTSFPPRSVSPVELESEPTREVEEPVEEPVQERRRSQPRPKVSSKPPPRTGEQRKGKRGVFSKLFFRSSNRKN